MNLIIKATPNWRDTNLYSNSNASCQTVHCPEYCWGGGDGPCNESVCPRQCLTQT